MHNTTEIEPITKINNDMHNTTTGDIKIISAKIEDGQGKFVIEVKDEVEKSLEDYPLIPMDDIEDEARLLAVRWVEGYEPAGFDLPNKHKLASDIMNYAKRQHEKQSNFEAFAIESIAENERTQIGEVDKPEELQEEVERLRDGWISVKSRLPELYEPGISIIVNVTDGKRVTCGYYDFEEKQWNGYGFHSEKGTHITNWKYLPQPPNR